MKPSISLPAVWTLHSQRVKRDLPPALSPMERHCLLCFRFTLNLPCAICLLKGDDFWTSNQGCTTDLIKRKIHLYPRDTTRVKGAKRRVFHTPQISYAWVFFTVKIENWLWGGVGVSSVLKIYPLIPGTYSILKLLLSLWIDNMSVFIMTGKPISLPLGLTRPPLTALISYVDWDSKILSPANTQLDSLGNTVISINLL